jgi:glucose/arabinose dehydrogenase
MRCLTFALIFCLAPALWAQRLEPHGIKLKSGKSFALNLPPGYEIRVAAEGLKRVRFFARAPDGRLFVTDMHDKSDNKRGAVYILDEWDAAAGRFGKVLPYLTNLRNPNSVAFLTDKQGQPWLYLALTDKLVRYRFTPGETKPTSAPQTLATYPDYGLNYKYGGWHLTRTIAPAPNGKIYVSVGSSCNACVEKEAVRASVQEMNPDGSGQRTFAKGLRNAVDLKWIGDAFMATNMGADHLGDEKPNDTVYLLQRGRDYGWPYCYQSGGKVFADPKFKRRGGCAATPKATFTFRAHSAPLGFEFFKAGENPDLAGSYLFALHGPTFPETMSPRGYKLLRVLPNGKPQDFVTGFLNQDLTVNGRPCGILRVGPDAFLFTDDHSGVIYYVFRKSETGV